MTYLIDTNVISELRKGARCNEGVAAWYATASENDLHLSVLVLGEIRKGLERLRPRDRQQAAALERWLETITQAFGERILCVDAAVCDEWGRMSAGRTVSVVDALLAATAKVHGLTRVTRNEDDVRGLGAQVLNPFA